MTTTPSMPIELTRHRESERADATPCVEPFVVRWRAIGARGVRSVDEVCVQVHDVRQDEIELSAGVHSRNEATELLAQQWLPGACSMDDDLVHVAIPADASALASLNGHAPAIEEHQWLLRITMTADGRALYVQSALPALAGFAAGRYEPPTVNPVRP